MRDTSPPGELPAADEASATGDRSLEALEKAALIAALERANGNISEVVRELGIGRTTVYRKMKKFGIRE